MARMTQTLTNPPPGPDPDPVVVVHPDQDPSPTRTDLTTRTGHYSDPDQDQGKYSDLDPDDYLDSDPGEYSDPDHSDPGPSPSPDTTRTRTTKTRTRRGAHRAAKITSGPDGPSPDTTRTRTTKTRTRTAGRAGAFHEWLALGGYLNVLTVVVAVVASLGQKEYAETKAHFVHQVVIGRFDLSPWLAPVVFDVSVAALLLGGLHWARRRHTPWPWWMAAAGIAGLSVVTNLQHTGWQITAPASAGLFLIWFLRLFFEYRQIRRYREVEDAGGDAAIRSTDILFDVDKALARRAWLIARTKPLTAGLAYRHSLGEIGELELTTRDLAIMLGRHYNTIYTDRLYLLTHPHLSAPAAAAPAGSDKDGTARRPGKVRWYHRSRLAEARRLAAMAAEDEVDRFLGLRVIERTGIIIAGVTYQETAPTTLLAAPPSRPARQSLPPAPPTDDDQAPQALPGPQPSRRRITRGPVKAIATVEATEIVEVRDPDGVVHTFEKPTGQGGKNWKPFAEVKGLETFYINPLLECRCGGSDPGKRCQWKLLEHAMRRGGHIEAVVAAVPAWATREKPIGKPDAQAAGVPGSGGQLVVMALMNQLRQLVAGQTDWSPAEQETA
jgi:hypothetical protein